MYYLSVYVHISTSKSINRSGYIYYGGNATHTERVGMAIDSLRLVRRLTVNGRDDDRSNIPMAFPIYMAIYIHTHTHMR